MSESWTWKKVTKYLRDCPKTVHVWLMISVDFCYSSTINDHKSTKSNRDWFRLTFESSGGPIKHAVLFTFSYWLIYSQGRSLSIKSAGLVGRNGPQSKQPFLVAFFKASGVLLRSVRAAGGKKKNHSRNKSTNQQETSRAPKPGGTVAYSPSNGRSPP